MHKRLIRYWSQDRSLSALLMVLVIELFVLVPRSEGGQIIQLGADLLFSLILLAGIVTLTKRKTLRLVFSILVVLSVLIHWARMGLSIVSLIGWDFLFSSIAVLAMLTVTLRLVYQDGPVTSHRIQGAVAAYLLIGVLFGRAYALISFLVPGAFSVSPTLMQVLPPGNMQTYYYFSISTLTTAGFGDITAVASWARSFVMVEALVGQLYPAILIARLVGLAVATGSKIKGKE